MASDEQSKMITISIPWDLDDLLTAAARRVHRSKSEYIRWQIIKSLKDLGMMDANGNPVPQSDWAPVTGV